MDLINNAALQREKTIKETAEEHRQQLGQHLTPKETAILAASMFDSTDHELECLDIGAGTGMLSIALIERYGELIGNIDCVEADPELAVICDGELKGVHHHVIVGDAITDTPNKLYDRVILNPPYKKMAADDSRQKLLPVRSPNLYTAFLITALSHLKDGGECVAIVPRSWMNGEYFTLFRKWTLTNYSLDAIHIYDSRTEVFHDTNVLQETMLARFSKREQVKNIKTSTSKDKSGDIVTHVYDARELIIGDDFDVRIAPATNTYTTLKDRGFCPSTGKVVDFRSDGHIFKDYQDALSHYKKSDIYPLIYAGNFRSCSFVHPADICKYQWFGADDEKHKKQLTQSGSYVLVKRFTAKEEKKRVCAYPLTLDTPAAIENHLNFIHAGTPRKVIPLESDVLSKGLAIWLNTTYIDNWFRDVSGSTQVNAKDIKAMPCPSVETLIEFGRHWHDNMTQEEFDDVTKDYLVE